MGKLKDKLFEIEDLLKEGFDFQTIAERVGVSYEFVVDCANELAGRNQH